MRPFKKGPVTARSMPFWCVGNPLGDPFGGGVLDPIESVRVAEILSWAANQKLIEATSFHDDDLVPWDPEDPEDDLDKSGDTAKTLAAVKKIIDRAGLSVNTATCSLHSDRIFRRGGLTNPDPQIRKLAALKVERALRIGHMFDARYFTYWVARDGFEVPVTVEWGKVYEWLASGLNHAHSYIKNKRFTNYKGGTIEPKPNEPRGQMFLPTSGHAVGFIMTHLKKKDFWGVNPELLQHESMTLMNAVMTVAYLVSTGKLTFLHFGNQVKGQFDNDYPPLVGPEGLKETAQMFWALEKTGWKGTVEFDCHMLRTEGDPDDPIGCRKTFIDNCVTALTISLELASRLKSFSVKGMAESEADVGSIMRMCGLNPKSISTMTRKR